MRYTLVVKGHNMQVSLDITFQNSEPSEAIRSEVEKQAKRLEKFHAQCRHTGFDNDGSSIRTVLNVTKTV
jgi:ribosome-associated translation inhibitor RaiA